MSECKCDIKKCQARCCVNAPIPASTFVKHLDKIVTQPYFAIGRDGREASTHLYNTDEYVYFVTDITGNHHNRCIFLTEDNRCNIYEDRPELCKKFGNPEIMPMLGCKWLGQKVVTDYTKMQVAQVLKNFGLMCRIVPDFKDTLEDMYAFVEEHPNGTVGDMYKWIGNKNKQQK